MNPSEYYRHRIDVYTLDLKRVKTCRNLVTSAKLVLFGGMVFLIYLAINDPARSLFFLGITGILLFIFLTVLDAKIFFRQRTLEEHLRLCTHEISYLQGDLSSFPTGESYLDPNHPYASDLDILGEDSLFQHLDRTVTAQGTGKLVSWLLSLSKDPETIVQRQQATAELNELPDWCHTFRVLGNLHPTQTLDSRIFQKWQEEALFFQRPRTTRRLLYLGNSIVLAAWSASLAGVVPFSIALSLSLIQLILLALCLKKINAYHSQLNTFIRTLSHYLPLVKAIATQEFTAPLLREIQQTLHNDSLKAFSRLHRIQNALDQRGNILLAVILNGLYLKDFHTLFRLDKWKKEFGRHIPAWIDAVSTTDALISMAIYRFNHPRYTIPLIGTTALLEAREAGHPLLKGERKVTNDFTIDRLHRLYIVTGANMAGKSTFLRTIGINLVLAQSGNVVYSTYFAFQPMALFTSMRTTDNLAKDTSYFHAELLRLKQLISLAEQEERLFIILDEMLKGTNSVDKLNGSLAFLRKLLDYPVSGLVATHDLALGELAHSSPEHFSNVCFEITHTDSDIRYDYKLRPGISTTMNASILLRQMGLI